METTYISVKAKAEDSFMTEGDLLKLGISDVTIPAPPQLEYVDTRRVKVQRWRFAPKWLCWRWMWETTIYPVSSQEYDQSTHKIVLR